MDALVKAFSEADRSYFAAKASIGQSTDRLLAGGPSGGSLFGEQSGFRNAKQQLDAFKSWVFAAIRPIANRIAAQPIKVSRPGTQSRIATKAVQDVLKHPILDLIANPNDLQTGWGLMWSTVAAINLCGRAFWWVPEGEKQIFMLPPSWVQGFTGTTRFQSWKVQLPGQSEPTNIPSERVVYFALPNPADPWGSISPLQACAAAVNSDDDILRSQRAAFSRGIHPSHAIIVGKQPVEGVPGGLRQHLTPAQHRQIISAIQKRYAGVEKHGEPFIIDGLIEDIKRLSNSPAEMDWATSAEAMKARILQTFGVSGYIIGTSEPGSRAASAVAEQHFLNSTVNPLSRMMSEAMSEWMAPMFGGGIRIEIEPAVADDADLRLQWATLLSQNGSLTVDELRAMAPLGLKEEKAFANLLVGGENMSGSNPIESGVRSIAERAVARTLADGGLLGDVMPALTGANGDGNSR